jgi:hypothetical protein
MKNSARKERRNHALSGMEYALLLVVIGALSLGLWSRVGRPLLDEWQHDDAVAPH